MTDPAELIVEFRTGVDQAAAEALIHKHGASVRRRMRSDDPNQVLLLVRCPKTVEALAEALGKEPSVARCEPNHGGFTLR